MTTVDDPALLDLLDRVDLAPRSEADALYRAIGRRLHTVVRGGPLTTVDEADVEEVTEIPGPMMLATAMMAIEGGEDAEASAHLEALSRRGLPEGPWRNELRAMLDLLALPGDLATSSDLAAEAVRVQWGSALLPELTAPHPHAVQEALLGLFAARARHLEQSLTVTIGPRMALERLHRWARARGLATVAGLGSRPERDSWIDDAELYWRLLGRAA